ncbi:MAG: TetR/AcrR family transcriptional regulator [Deltaproteobacteria bacterium]|nr:TetR/AcrR family transcriptional regulator [Deltaproteobacteria bacterium]
MTVTATAIKTDRRSRRKQQTRGALLEAGMRLFAERGIYATRIEDITEQADVAKGAFYNYFDSKDALVAALLGAGITVLETDYLLAVSGRGSMEARLAELTEAHWRFFDDHPEQALLLHQARGLAHLKTSTEGPLRAVMTAYLGAIGRQLPVASLALAARDLMRLAAAFAGAISGPRSFAIAAGFPVDLSIVRDMVAGGLAKILQRAERTGALAGAPSARAPRVRQPTRGAATPGRDRAGLG